LIETSQIDFLQKRVYSEFKDYSEVALAEWEESLERHDLMAELE
jgi:hypothetical protein